MQQQQRLVLPRVISVNTLALAQNSISALVFTTDGTFVYYVLALDGAGVQTPTSAQVLAAAATATPTLQAQQAVGALQSGREQTLLASAPNPVQLNQNTAQIDLDALAPQTNYALFLVATNPLGNSDVYRFSFRTSRPSFGCLVNIPLSQPVDPDVVVAALSRTLRLPPARFIAQTTRAQLDEAMAQYNPSTMSAPGLIF